MRILMYHTFGFSRTAWNVYEGFARELEMRGLEVLRVSDPSWSVRPMWKDFFFRGEFERLIGKLKPDLVHVHSIRTPLGRLLLRAAQKNHVPVIAHIHTYRVACPLTLHVKQKPINPCNSVYPCLQCLKCILPNGSLGSLKTLMQTPIYMQMLRSIYKNVDAIVSPSSLYRNLLQQMNFTEAIHIPNMVNRNQLTRFASISETPRCDDKMQSILFLGRLAPEKGVHFLPQIARRLADTRVDVAGDGVLHDWLVDHKPSNMVIHGYLQDDAKYPLMANCSMLIVPSSCAELYPTVMLEAFVMGKPVVAFAHGGSKEIVEESGGGLLADPFDINSFIERTKYLLENPDVARQKGNIAHKWVMKTCHPNIVINQLIDVYNKAANN